MNNLPNQFRLYLIGQGSSPLTIKNYLSDVHRFFDWLARKTGIHYQVAGKAIFGIFTAQTIEEYQQDLISAKIPPSTINRYLSTLRKLGEFAKTQGWLTENPAVKINNITLKQVKESGLTTQEKILEEFRKDLEKEKASSLTIKNYLVDIRHFLNWLGEN